MIIAVDSTYRVDLPQRIQYVEFSLVCTCLTSYDLICTLFLLHYYSSIVLCFDTPSISCLLRWGDSNWAVSVLQALIGEGRGSEKPE